ncbi:kinase-like domain-containing protein [Roridomyces roridus]|uniref:Kinase-like domain-containing protein n=1 Tax=Roridomyces roridus TaxID=1738132 RepID=A0AAD7BE88_9AGAR|nr:kinase-like domain-containing protein [Roridomyces roridus]
MVSPDLRLRYQLMTETDTLSDAVDPAREYIWELPNPPRELEPLTRYHAGGLHPVHLADMYNGARYRIVNKLGFGSSSHVWLGEDTTAKQRPTRPLALKFIEAKASERTLEIEIHKYLSAAAGEAGSKHILPFLDTFRVEGPNGVHNVIVSDGALAFIPALCKYKILEDLDETEIVRQIFEGVAFLHENGVVHRDLHCGNIGIEIPFFRTAGIRKLTYGDPPIIFPSTLCEAVEHPPSVPKYIVQSSPALVDRYQYKDAPGGPLVVKLVDFGCAFRPGTDSVFPTGSPRRTLAAPECLVSEIHLPPSVPEKVWTFKSDIWTLGCTLVELYSRLGHSLFDGAGSSSLGAEMAKLVGPIPDMYHCLLDDNATLHHSDTHNAQSDADTEEDDIPANWKTLETSLVAARTPRHPPSAEDELKRVDRDTKDVQRFLPLIKQMLRWNAEDRIQASEALESSFLVEK